MDGNTGGKIACLQRYERPLAFAVSRRCSPLLEWYPNLEKAFRHRVSLGRLDATIQQGVAAGAIQSYCTPKFSITSRDPSEKGKTMPQFTAYRSLHRQPIGICNSCCAIWDHGVWGCCSTTRVNACLAFLIRVRSALLDSIEGSGSNTQIVLSAS